MSGHAPEERFKPQASDNARKARGAAAVKRTAETPPFDADLALALLRKTLRKVYR